MSLSPQQLQALFQGISSGNQGGFANSTPGMGQDERNQWINSYGTGGTNYGDYLNWYGNQNGTNNQQPTGQNTPLMASLQNPTGADFSQSGYGGLSAGAGAGPGSFQAGQGPKGTGMPANIPGPGNDTRPVNPQTQPGSQQGVGLGTPGWMQYYTPGSGNGPNNPYAVGPGTMPQGGGGPGGPTPGVTPSPSTGVAPTQLGRPKSNYSFMSGGWSQPNPWGGTKWG